ncbi:MAG TPA: hypothetical protein VF113_14305 [Stellaceae bacterium]
MDLQLAAIRSADKLTRAKAGIQGRAMSGRSWVPACAGTTKIVFTERNCTPATLLARGAISAILIIDITQRETIAWAHD